MNALRSSLALSCALALAVSCSKQEKDREDPRVIANVNGEILSRAEFERELAREMQSTDGAMLKLPEETEPFKRALVQTLVERMLLLQAARSLNVTVPPEDIDRGVLRQSADYPAEGFNEALAQGHMSMAELKEKTRAMLTVERLFQEHVYPRVAVSEDELRKYYEEHAAAFQEPEQVRAAQIVVKGLDEARRLQQQLYSGKKFSDLARKYSLSPDAKVGGDLGFFPRGVMPPKFDEVAFKMDPGQVSDVIGTEYGFHLFKVLERKKGRQRDFIEVKREVEAALLKEKRARAQAEYLHALKEKASLKVNEKTVQLASARAPGAMAAEP